MKVLITGSSGLSSGVALTLEDGTKLRNIESCIISMKAQEFVTAEIKFVMPIIDVVGMVTVSEDHLRELAHAHGFELVKLSKLQEHG